MGLGQDTPAGARTAAGPPSSCRATPLRRARFRGHRPGHYLPHTAHIACYPAPQRHSQMVPPKTPPHNIIRTSPEPDPSPGTRAGPAGPAGEPRRHRHAAPTASGRTPRRRRARPRTPRQLTQSTPDRSARNRAPTHQHRHRAAVHIAHQHQPHPHTPPNPHIHPNAPHAGAGPALPPRSGGEASPQTTHWPGYVMPFVFRPDSARAITLP
jgi:hypothetical protein